MPEYVLRKASMSTDEIREAKDALNEKMRSYRSIGEFAKDTDAVWTVGTLVRQLADAQFRQTDPMPLVYNQAAGPGLGNQLEIEEYVNTSRVVERSLGGKPRTFTPAKNVYSVELKDFRVDYAFELEQVLTGQMKAEVWVDHMAEAISRHNVSTGLNTLDLACAAGVKDAYNRDVRTIAGSGKVDQTTLDAALARLGDVNPGVTILGRYSALFPILGFEGYSNEALEEIRRVGMIGTYKGANVVVIRDNYNPFYKQPSVPLDRIYLVGGEKGGTFYEEDMSALDYEVVDVEEQHFRVGTKLRSTYRVFKPWMYHVIELSQSSGGGGQ